MAIYECTRFPLLGNIADDSIFVHLAMAQLGFACEFADMALADMHSTLALDVHLKRGAEPQIWEVRNDGR